MSLTDLHTHTTRSDGTLTPIELVEAALRAGVRTLAVTDHDRVFEAPEASQAAARQGLDLICGIELSCRHEGRTVHLLGYFFNGVDRSGFDAWLRACLSPPEWLARWRAQAAAALHCLPDDPVLSSIL